MTSAYDRSPYDDDSAVELLDDLDLDGIDDDNGSGDVAGSGPEGDFDGDQLDLADRNALRRVAGLSTELADVTEVEYRQLRLERVAAGQDPKRSVTVARNGQRGYSRSHLSFSPVQSVTRGGAPVSTAHARISSISSGCPPLAIASASTCSE
jgi:hypothetical protein